MNKTAQKHLDAIRAGKVDRTNVIGLRKLINASERAARGYSVGVTACTVSGDDLLTIENALGTCCPVVCGELHTSGLALLRSPRYAKRLQNYLPALEGEVNFHLIRFDRIDNYSRVTVPVYRVTKGDDHMHLFTFRNIPWQSGGEGPEIQGKDF